jgi:hypothetical protein
MKEISVKIIEKMFISVIEKTEGFKNTYGGVKFRFI